MKPVWVKQNAPSGESHCNSSLPTVISKTHQFEEFGDYEANSATGLFAQIRRNGASNLNFRLPQILRSLEQVRRPSGVSSGRLWSTTEFAPCVEHRRGTLLTVLLSGWDAHGEGRATLPSSKTQSSSGPARVAHCADLKRLTKGDVQGRADDAAQVMPGKGYRNEN
jgi:hypothetical protein